MASKLERDLAAQLDLMGRDERWAFPPPVTEYRFAPERRYRADFAWPDQRVLVECEGGGWSSGRHTRGAGFEADMEKYNTAMELGFTVVRVSQRSITSGEALRWIESALRQARPAPLADASEPT